MRRPASHDARAVGEVLAAFDRADVGRVDYDEAWVIDRWSRPGFRLERDAWVIEDRAGRIVGYFGGIEQGDGFESEGVVHPEHAGRGLGSVLVDALTERTSADRRWVRAWISASDAGAERLFADRGFERERVYIHREIELSRSTSPVDASAPPGVGIRPPVRERDAEVTFGVLQEALAGEWGWDRARLTVERWSEELRDATVALLAEERGRSDATGVIVCGSDGRATGWIDWLAVRPDRQRRGIGAALCRAAIRELAASGLARVRVAVDEQNRSAAYDFYDRLGMPEIRRFVTVRKSFA